MTWDDRAGLAIGGGTMLGLGVGFFFLRTSPLYFVGCLLAGIGAGLVVAAIISQRNSTSKG